MRWLRIVGLALALGGMVGVYAAVMIHHGGGDFSSLYLAELRQDIGQPIYWPAPESNPHLMDDCPDGIRAPELQAMTGLPRSELVKLPLCFHTNLNPPFFIVFAGLLAKLGYSAAWWTWFFLSMGCFIWTVRAFLLEGFLSADEAKLGWVLVMAALLYFPTIMSFLFGQVTSVIMLPLVLGWLKLRRGEDALGGIWLGVAASMKPFLGLFLIGLLVQKNSRAVMAMLVVGAVCALIGLLADGLNGYRGYLEALNTVSWHAASWNASFSGLFSRFFGGSQNTPWIDAPRLAHGLTFVAGFWVLVAYFRGLSRTREWPASSRADLLCASTLPAMLLISPLGWLYYFPLLLLSATVLWRYSSGLPEIRRFRGALGVSMILLGTPSWMISAKDMNSPLDWFGAAGFYPVALLQLFALSMMVIWRRGASDVS